MALAPVGLTLPAPQKGLPSDMQAQSQKVKKVAPVEPLMDAPRPHEQHRFRAGRGVGEHFWLASCFSVNIPVSICLECVILWTLIWVLQRKGLPGGIVGDFGQSDQFLITGSVRQGCVLSPADAKLIFARSHHVLAQLVASLMIHLEKVGLHFYAGAAASNCCNGWRISVVLVKNGWVAGWQPEGRNHNTSIWNIICSKHRHFVAQSVGIWLARRVSISKRCRYFNAVASSVACFGSGHQAIYNTQLATLDVHFRKICRSIVGPPLKVAWNAT